MGHRLRPKGKNIYCINIIIKRYERNATQHNEVKVYVLIRNILKLVEVPILQIFQKCNQAGVNGLPPLITIQGEKEES